MLKEERTTDPALRLEMHNLSRQPHDQVFEDVVTALAGHPGWAGCAGCRLLEDGSCPIRRNLAVLSDPRDPGMRARLRGLIRLAAFNDNHLPIRHVLLLAVNVILGVSGRDTALMRCAMADGEGAAANPYDNALGLNLPEGGHAQYRAFTVFADMGLGRETNNAVDGVLVEAQPRALYDAMVRSDPVFGEPFDAVRSWYQRGALDDFGEFQRAIERQRRRLFFAMPRFLATSPGDADPWFDPWRLTVFSFGGEYLDFAAALTGGKAIDAVRARLVTGLNRSYTGAMTDEGQQVWFASPAANTQSRIGRVLDIEVPVGRSRRFACWFDFDCDAEAAHGRPRMAVRLADGTVAAGTAVTPLLFEYLLRVEAGSLPGSFSRQCFEELRQFRVGADGALRQEAVAVLEGA